MGMKFLEKKAMKNIFLQVVAMLPSCNPTPFLSKHGNNI